MKCHKSERTKILLCVFYFWCSPQCHYAAFHEQHCACPARYTVTSFAYLHSNSVKNDQLWCTFIMNHFESNLCCFPFFFKITEHTLMENIWVSPRLDHSGHPLLISLHIQIILPSAYHLLHAVCYPKIPSTHADRGHFKF